MGYFLAGPLHVVVPCPSSACEGLAPCLMVTGRLHTLLVGIRTAWGSVNCVKKKGKASRAA